MHGFGVKGVRASLAAALALAGGTALAQQLYRCGNTYSQVPCAANAEPKLLRDNSVGGSAAAAAQNGRDLCRRQAPGAAGLADPYSAVIESVSDGKHDTIHVGSEMVVARRFDVALNAKNAFGAYSGVRTYHCFVSEDGQRLLKVQVPAEPRTDGPTAPAGIGRRR